jgi:hypothetical protein
MSMLQYRHKSRAWNAMVAADEHGVSHAIKDKIARSIEEATGQELDKGAAVDALMEQLRSVRSRLAPRIPGMPDDATLKDHLNKLNGETVRTLVRSGAWDTLIVGGEEVDIDIFYQQNAPIPSVPEDPHAGLTRVVPRGTIPG